DLDTVSGNGRHPGSPSHSRSEFIRPGVEVGIECVDGRVRVRRNVIQEEPDCSRDKACDVVSDLSQKDGEGHPRPPCAKNNTYAVPGIESAETCRSRGFRREAVKLLPWHTR